MKVIEKHALWLRIVHWLNVPLLLIMIWSGLLIYWAHDIYAPFFPQWFYNALNINGKLAQGLALHFFFAWFFILNAAFYLVRFFVSGHWREIFPNRQTPQQIVPTLLHDIGLNKSKLPEQKFNAIQRLAYTSVVVFGLMMILTGFAMYKPVQLGWLTSLMGGYETARLIHFVVTLLFCAFIFVHIVQVLRAGWNNLRSMIAGFEVQDDK